MKRENQISSNGSDNLTLPESYELEKAILGALILEPDNVSDVRAIIGASAFYHPQNAKIYEAICRLDDQGIAPDLVSVDREARRVGVPLYDIVLLTQAVGSAIGILSHARQLRELECLRRLVLLGTELSARASDGNHSADEVGGWITQQIEEIAAKTARVDDIAPLSSVVRVALDGLGQRQNARQSGECVGVPTGLSRLDALTGGWRGGQLIVLAGRPAMGKSAAMLHFARSAAASGVPVCIFSLEMPAEQLVGRLLIGASGVDSGNFRTGCVDADGWRGLEQAGEELSGLPVYLNDRANVSMSTIRSQCKAMQRRGCCGMVIVDYLQLLDTTTEKRNDSREREIAAASRAAKLLAKELDVPVILLSQLSRKIEERADKTPLLSDLRESGAIEQDADIVAFIDRPAMYGVETIEAGRYGVISSSGVGVLHIAKNREGATGAICFSHNESLTKITDYDTAPSTSTTGPF